MSKTGNGDAIQIGKRIFYCSKLKVGIIENVTYIPGTPIVSYYWNIINYSPSAINNLKFFHGQDNYLSGGDTGAGFWYPSQNAVETKTLMLLKV